MKTFIAYTFGFLGFLIQGGALIGLPIFVFFFGKSWLWLLAIIPLGFVGMIPLSIMQGLLKTRKEESDDYDFKNLELGLQFKAKPRDVVWGEITKKDAEIIQQGFMQVLREANLQKYNSTNSLPDEVLETISKIANEMGEKNNLNPSFLILLAHQYVDADSIKRQRYASSWIASMVQRANFAPSPESYVDYIKSTYFSNDE